MYFKRIYYLLLSAFLDKRFNGCHDVLAMSMKLNNIVILNICGVDYCCIINGAIKIEAINFLRNAYLYKNVDQ